jgi:hypothetical protein
VEKEFKEGLRDLSRSRTMQGKAKAKVKGSAPFKWEVQAELRMCAALGFTIPFIGVCRHG